MKIPNDKVCKEGDRMANNEQIQAVCIIADVIDSRKNEKEKELQKVVQLMNNKYEKDCIAPFTKRMGDEIFGVLANYSDAYYVLKDLFDLSRQKNLPLYIGIGIGSVFDEQANNANHVNGTAIWNAADTIDRLKNNDPAVKYFKNKPSTFKYFFYANDENIPDMLINYITSFLFEKIEKRTDKQEKIIRVYEAYPAETLEEIGKKLGYTHNPGLNVSKTLTRSNYHFIESAEQELIKLLTQIQLNEFYNYQK